MQKYSVKKIILYTISALFLILLAVFGGMYTIDQYTYQKDSRIISSTYQNRKQNILIKNPDVNALNHIPDTYNRMRLFSHCSKIKAEYNRIKPLYTLQVSVQDAVKKLYNGKNYYSDNVTEKKLQNLLSKAQLINNQKVQSDLIVNIDDIDLWYSQTQNADRIISKLNNKQKINFNDYVQAQANYILIKNKKIKHKAKRMLLNIKQKYKQSNQLSKKEYQDKVDQAVAEAKRQASVKYSHAPAKVTVTVISKKDQEVTKALFSQDSAINSEKVVFIQGNVLYLLQKQGNYYTINTDIPVSGSVSETGEYTPQLTVNSSRNGVQNYHITNQGALMLDSNDSKHGQYTVFNIRSNFSSTGNYLSLTGSTRLLLAVNGNAYILLSPDNLSDSNSNTYTVSEEDYRKIVDFINSNTVFVTG